MNYVYEYPRPAVSVDIMVCRKRGSRTELLLIERKNQPFAGAWALPGGFLDGSESLEMAAARELREETGLVATKLSQIKAYSAPDRDPRTRVISVAFAAEVSSDAQAVAADDAASLAWFDIKQIPDLAFDHNEIINDGLRLI